MKALDLVQGSKEWHTHRRTHLNASDAPAMMGVSPYETRSQLLHRLATGVEKEIDEATRRRFADGHRFEELARPVAEEIIGEPLYPIVGKMNEYSASFDGLTIGEDIAYEHKSLNDDIRAYQSASDISALHRIQMEQQLMVSGAEKCLFMASRWDGDTLIEEKHLWYLPDLHLRASIEQGWIQLKKDRDAYVHTEAAVIPVAAPIRDLPAIRYQLNGLSLTTNLAEYKTEALILVEESKKELHTDQDFVDQDAFNKKLKTAEANIELMIAQVIGEVKDIDKFQRDMKEIGELLAKARIAGEKKVDTRKAEIKAAAVQRGKAAFAEHVARCNKAIGKEYMPIIATDFPGVIKGLRTGSSMNNAIDTELARAKIEANAIADRIAINLKYLELNAGDYLSLFPDVAQIVLKSEDDFASLLKVRIADHKEAEAKRVEAARVAKEKADADARALADAKAVEAVKPLADAARAEMEVVVQSVPIGVRPAPLPVTAKDPDEIINTVTNMMRGMDKPQQLAVLNAAIAIQTKQAKAA